MVLSFRFFHYLFFSFLLVLNFINAFAVDSYFSDCSNFKSNLKACSIDTCILKNEEGNFYQFISAGHFGERCKYTKSFENKITVCLLKKDSLISFSDSALNLSDDDYQLSKFDQECVNLDLDNQGLKLDENNSYAFTFMQAKAKKMIGQLLKEQKAEQFLIE